MGKTNKKTGYSCIEKKFGKKESLKEKIKRSLRNVKYVCQRAKYGYCDSDVWSIDYWFLRVMPGMLQQLKDTTDSYPDFPEMTTHAVYMTGRPKDVEDEGMEKWQDVLQEMIFLLREANEETCTRENRYEHEYDEATYRFEEKYGSLGEKLKTKEDMEREKTEGLHKMFMPGDVPEFKDISDRYYEEYAAINEYRNQCKDKVLELFGKWFWHLWD